MAFVRAAAVTDIPAGSIREIDLAGTAIAVANVDSVAGHAAGIIMIPERGRCAIPATGPIICYRD